MDFEFTVVYTQIILTLMLVNIKIVRKKKLLEMCLLFRFGLLFAKQYCREKLLITLIKKSDSVLA